jgi:hypothetical protein
MHRALFIILFISCCSFLIPTDNPTDLLVMKAAESQLPIFLAKIRPGDEGIYGFTENDDLDGCAVGKPFRMLVFNDDFYAANKLVEEKNYITIKNEWRVPVTIRDTNRTLLIVDGNPGNYTVSGMGAPLLAKELQQVSTGAWEHNSFYLLQVSALLADFFVTERDNSFIDAQFVPLESAIMAIPALNKNKKPFYSLTEVENMVKEELKTSPVNEPKKERSKQNNSK